MTAVFQKNTTRWFLAVKLWLEINSATCVKLLIWINIVWYLNASILKCLKAKRIFIAGSTFLGVHRRFRFRQNRPSWRRDGQRRLVRRWFHQHRDLFSEGHSELHNLLLEQSYIFLYVLRCSFQLAALHKMLRLEQSECVKRCSIGVPFTRRNYRHRSSSAANFPWKYFRMSPYVSLFWNNYIEIFPFFVPDNENSNLVWLTSFFLNSFDSITLSCF